METNYVNIGFIKKYAFEFQKKFHWQVAKIRAAKTDTLQPQEASYLAKAGPIVEFIIRSMIGSEEERVLRFDVPYTKFDATRYLETDIVKHETDGSLVIGEIKSSYNMKLGSARKQLEKRCSILYSKYTKIKPVAIHINMAADFITNTASEKTISINGFTFWVIQLTIGDVIQYASANHLNIDFKLLLNASSEAQERLIQHHKTQSEKLLRKQKLLAA